MATENKIALLLLTSLLSSTSLAKSFSFTPSIGVEETYSDNLNLTRVDQQSGLVSQFNLNLASEYEGNGSSFSLSSSNTYSLFSNDSSLNTSFSALDADGIVQLWPNGISLTGSATIQNQARNSAVSSSNSLLFNDTVQTQSYQTGLLYSVNNRHHITSSNLDFSTSSSEDNIAERTSTTFNLNSENGNAARTIFWDSSASFTQTNNSNNSSDSEQSSADIKLGYITNHGFTPFVRYFLEDISGNISSSTFETESLGVGFRWLILPRLFVDVSYNEPFGNSSDTVEEQEAYTDALLNWQPSSRTQIELGYTQRFFGDSYNAQITHQNRRLTNTLSYTETVRTFTRDNFVAVTSEVFCSNITATDISNCITLLASEPESQAATSVNVTTLELVEDNNFSLNKVFSWTSTLSLPKTSFTSNARYTSRENLSDDSSSESLIKFLSFQATRNISQNTSLRFLTSYTDQQISASTVTQNDLTRRYSLTYNKNINDLLTMFVTIGHTNRNSNVDNLTYNENRISFNLSKDF